jgi:hypothetical protein
VLIIDCYSTRRPTQLVSMGEAPLPDWYSSAKCKTCNFGAVNQTLDRC